MIVLKHSGNRDASFRAGMTTVMEGTVPLDSASGGRRRAARKIMRSAATPAII
jgi:hypothetical protein